MIDVNGLHPCKDKLRVMKDAPRSKDLSFKIYTNPFNSSGKFKYMDKGGCRWRWTNTEERAFEDTIRHCYLNQKYSYLTMMAYLSFYAVILNPSEKELCYLIML